METHTLTPFQNEHCHNHEHVIECTGKLIYANLVSPTLSAPSPYYLCSSLSDCLSLSIVSLSIYLFIYLPISPTLHSRFITLLLSSSFFSCSSAPILPHSRVSSYLSLILPLTSPWWIQQNILNITELGSATVMSALCGWEMVSGYKASCCFTCDIIVLLFRLSVFLFT